jgi:hypothetical protein
MAMLLAFILPSKHTDIHIQAHICISLAPTNQPAMASPQLTMVIFLVVLLASSSPCLARASRMMILSDHHAQPNSIKSSSISTSPAATSATTSTTSPQQLAQGVAVPSPPVAPATVDDVDHPESNGGWIPEGSVPSPGVGHHP